MKTLDEGATKSAALFPDNSKTGGGTAALPAIWQNKADFDARFAKFVKDVAAAQAGIVDEATLQETRSGRLPELRRLPRALQGQERLRLEFAARG